MKRLLWLEIQGAIPNLSHFTNKKGRYMNYLSQGQGMTPSQIRKFYRDQLNSFYKIGIGNKTNNRVVVTQTLIDVTKRRLKQLTLKKIGG